MDIRLIIAIIALVISWILYFYYQSNYRSNNQLKGSLISDKCEDVVYDPVTLKRIPITSKRGDEIFKYKLIFYLNKYLEDTKDNWNYILPTQFNKMDKSNLFILDTRKPEDYKKGHIKNSLNIFWLDLMKNENLKKLPKDKDIVIVCYVGHTASQVLVLLKLLGYKARVLKFGMGISPSKGVPIAGWTSYGFKVTN